VSADMPDEANTPAWRDLHPGEDPRVEAMIFARLRETQRAALPLQVFVTAIPMRLQTSFSVASRIYCSGMSSPRVSTAPARSRTHER
jgi:hypothetical protein